MTAFLVWMLGYPLLMETIRLTTSLVRFKLGQKPFDDDVQGVASWMEWFTWLIVGSLIWWRMA